MGPPALQYQLPALLFACVLFVFFGLFVAALSGKLRQNQGRGLVDQELVHAPRPLTSSNFIAGRSKAALLVWFFDDFRHRVLLFMVILVIYKYINS